MTSIRLRIFISSDNCFGLYHACLQSETLPHVQDLLASKHCSVVGQLECDSTRPAYTNVLQMFLP